MSTSHHRPVWELQIRHSESAMVLLLDDMTGRPGAALWEWMDQDGGIYS